MPFVDEFDMAGTEFLERHGSLFEHADPHSPKGCEGMESVFFRRLVAADILYLVERWPWDVV